MTYLKEFMDKEVTIKERVESLFKNLFKKKYSLKFAPKNLFNILTERCLLYKNIYSLLISIEEFLRNRSSKFDFGCYFFELVTGTSSKK